MSEQEGRDRTGASKYIPMYYSYIEQLSLLTTEQVGELVMALLRFGADGTEPTFSKDSNVYMAFSFILDSTKRASERSHARGVNGGLARAAGAEKDAKGRFLPSPSSNHPAKLQQPSSKIQQVQQTQQVQPYQYQYQSQYQKQYRLNDETDESCVESVESELQELYEGNIDTLGADERRKLHETIKRYGAQIVETAIMRSIEKGARSWSYVQAAIETQARHPDLKPEYR